MTAAQFRAWRARMALSLTGAGLALGISRRMVASYQSGEYPVPIKIMYLCHLLEGARKFDAAQERGNG